MQYSYPSFMPSDVGLKAPYTVDFSLDQTAIIPINGTYQGDGVTVRSVHVNNLNNPALVTYTMQGGGGTIPAYSDGFINIDGQSAITFQCSQASQIIVELTTARYPAGFISRGLPPNSNTAVFTSGDSIQKGDIISQGADGLAYWGADPNTSQGVLRPINRTAATYFTPVSTISTLTKSLTLSVIKKIDTETYWLAGNNTSVDIYKISATGQIVASYLNFNASGALNNLTCGGDIIKLNTGDIAVCFGNNNTGGTNNGFTFARFDAALTALKSSFQFGDVTNTNNASQCSMVQTADNNLHVFYVSSGRTRWIGFDSTFTGSTVKTDGQLYVSPVGTTLYNVNYRIVAACLISNNTINVIETEYNGTTVFTRLIKVVTSPQSVVSITTDSGGGDDVWIKPLKNGNFLSYFGGNQLRLLNSSGAIITTIGMNGNVQENGFVDLNTYALAIGGTNADLRIVEFNTTTGAITRYVDNATGLSGTISNKSLLLMPGNNIFVVMGWISTAPAKIFGTTFDYAKGTFAGNSGSIETVVGDSISFGYTWSLNDRYTLAYVARTAAGTFKIESVSAYNQLLTPVGIALNDAPLNAKVTVQTTGTQQTRLNFILPYTVNAQAQNPPGQKMNILGNSATMAGIQA